MGLQRIAFLMSNALERVISHAKQRMCNNENLANNGTHFLSTVLFLGAKGDN